MGAIGKRNFNYRMKCRNIAMHQILRGAGQQTNTTYEDKQTSSGYPWRHRPCRIRAFLSRPG